MASIERTAYPGFKRTPSAKELEGFYTPSEEELQFVRAVARKALLRFGMLLLLKSFDVPCNIAHWTSWNRHFGPLSGSAPKIDHPGARYILATFTYGCNLGPARTSRHLRGADTLSDLEL